MTIPSTNISFGTHISPEVQLPTTNLRMGSGAVTYLTNGTFSGQVSVSSMRSITAINNYMAIKYASAAAETVYVHLIKKSGTTYSGVVFDQGTGGGLTTSSTLSGLPVTLAPNTTHAALRSGASAQTITLAKRTLATWSSVSSVSVASTLTIDSNLAWDDTSTYLAAPVYSDGSVAFVPIKVWSRSGDTLTELSLPTTTIGSAATTRAISWSPDGSVVMCGGDGGSSSATLQRYSRSGTTFTKLGAITDDPQSGSTVYSIAYNPAGTLVAVAFTNSSSTPLINIYSISGTTYTRTQQYTGLTAAPRNIHFDASGSRLIVSTFSTTAPFWYFSVSGTTVTYVGQMTAGGGEGERASIAATTEGFWATALSTSTATSGVLYHYGWNVSTPTSVASSGSLSGGYLGQQISSSSLKAVPGHS